MAYNPYARYAAQSVMTMTKGEMLAKLYEALIKNMNLAVRAIEQKDVNATNQSLQKAQSIITYLVSTLDRKYPISNNLMALYDFFNRQLIAANVKKDSGMILEIIPLVEDLRATFIECDKRARMGVGTQTETGERFAAIG